MKNNPLAPKFIPAHLGPHRRKAVLASQDGWCAICDDLPIPWGKNDRNGRKGHRYTCQREACMKAWALLCSRDHKHARRQKAQPSGMYLGKSAA